jgi:hypothetical protein
MQLEHDPEKHALGLDARVDTGSSEMLMLKRKDIGKKQST